MRCAGSRSPRQVVTLAPHLPCNWLAIGPQLPPRCPSITPQSTPPQINAPITPPNQPLSTPQLSSARPVSHFLNLPSPNATHPIVTHTHAFPRDVSLYLHGRILQLISKGLLPKTTRRRGGRCDTWRLSSSCGRRSESVARGRGSRHSRERSHRHRRASASVGRCCRPHLNGCALSASHTPAFPTCHNPSHPNAFSHSSQGDSIRRLFALSLYVLFL